MQSCLVKSFDYFKDAVDLAELFKAQPNLFFLDSSLKDPLKGRYSFIGFSPFEILQDSSNASLRLLKQKFLPFSNIEKILDLPFSSGMVGYFSYDNALHHEKMIPRLKVRENIPECFLGFYDLVLVVDHFSNKLTIISTGLPEANSQLRKLKAKERLEFVENRLLEMRQDKEDFSPELISSESSLRIKSNFTKGQYCEAVKKALEYIASGEIYQVNLAQEFYVDLEDEVDSFEIYKALRLLSPSCFSSYLDCGSFQILSSSPERFLKKTGSLVTTVPMKGTRERGGNFTSDQLLKKELVSSVKDKAELLMITDLERNDLGKVCEFGEVRVKEMRSIEEYKTVFQATSTVEGILRKDKDCFDLIDACFPGGSITGCPKIRSMQIIEEIEPSSRGIYTGCLGYVDFSGDLDLNILIRTMFIKENKISFHVGSGIVADSIPEKEYEETLVKAKAMMNCLKQVKILNKHLV